MKRKEFLKKTGIAAAGLGMALRSNATGNNYAYMDNYPIQLSSSPQICILVPAETLGPFPSLPGGDAMYWRNNITDGMAGVPLNFTIKLFGTNNCGFLPGYRIDVWHCNANGYYSHFAASGMNNGHSGQNHPGATNATLIYGRGSQVTDANGEVSFTTVFPGWYPGRTLHIHFAIYSGGTPGTPNGWIQERVSQFTFPITEKNSLLTGNVPYNLYGADPQHPDSDNVFNMPAGEWSNTQLATLNGTGAGPYTSSYETAITATGVIPLGLLGFDGSAFGQSCLLRWRTENETNFSHFELEYSPNADDFDFLARIDSKGNNISTRNDYMYEDKDRLVFGNAFYRLKMVDIDGTASYSSVAAIHNSYRLPIKIRTNPVSDHLILYHPYSTGKEKILVTDLPGRAVGIGKLDAGSGYTRVDLSICSKGMHFLIYSDGKYTQALKFLKN